MFSSNSAVAPLPVTSCIDVSSFNKNNSSSNKNRRRSKSMDELYHHDNKKDRLSCYLLQEQPTSPIITFQQQQQQQLKEKTMTVKRRRHSLGTTTTASMDLEYVRLAKIYGWVYHHHQSIITTTTKTKQQDQNLKSSRSLTHIPLNGSGSTGGGAKLTRMFGRCTTNTTSLLFPNKSTSTSSSYPSKSTTAVVAATSLFNKKNKEKEQQPHYQRKKNCIEEKEELPAVVAEEEILQPEPPIENDPHVFDVLSKNSSLFIHYGKKNDDITVTSATIEKLVEKLTREMDNDFLMDFFLTFRQFTTPIKLCKLLILRFRWALLLKAEDDDGRLVRIRTFVVIRHWLTHYWTFDFLPSHTLRFMLSTFLTQLLTHPIILTSPRDERIIKNLRSTFKRQRKYYQGWSSSHEETSVSLCHRKDSAIGGIPSSNRNNTTCIKEEEKKKDHHRWTNKVKRSIKRSVSTNTTTSSLCSITTTCQPIDNTSNNNKKSPLFIFTRRLPHQQHYKSIILKYRSEIIAQQFCMIEQSMLQRVTWDELVELKWRKRSSKRQSFIIELSPDNNLNNNEGVDHLIGYFNQVCQWVASEIVLSHHLENRVKTIEKFIRIAFKCFTLSNYSTLMQILLGLQSPAVSRLTRTWDKLDPYQLTLFQQLKELAKPYRNWKNVRDYMTRATEQVAESFAVESVLMGCNSMKEEEGGRGGEQQGCIPFLGLYLSDLVFIAELPTFVDSHHQSSSSSDDEEEEDDDDNRELCERLSHHLVNYNKFRITASVVKHVLAFQVLSRSYTFKLHPLLYSQLSRFDLLLDNSQIRKSSFQCQEA